MSEETNKSQAPDSNVNSREPSWAEKFAVAGRGLRVAFTQEKSFVGHFVITAGVIVAGVLLGLEKWEWCVVVLCVMAGLSTELLNTAIERLALVITREYHPEIRNALDIAGGAVLIISMGAAILGLTILGSAMWRVAFA